MLVVVKEDQGHCDSTTLGEAENSIIWRMFAVQSRQEQFVRLFNIPWGFSGAGCCPEGVVGRLEEHLDAWSSMPCMRGVDEVEGVLRGIQLGAKSG